MVGDARRRHGELFRDLAGGEVALFEHFENTAAGGITESFEEKVQGLYN